MSSNLTAKFWDQVYQESKDGWTTLAADQALMKHFSSLEDGRANLKILLPMCGRTEVMLTFAERNHVVVGIEWSESAVEKFFEEHRLEYDKKAHQIGKVGVPMYVAREKNITIYQCDFFLFQQDNLGGHFDVVFDHGSIGSFECSADKRKTYAKIIGSFLKSEGRLLFSFFDYVHSEHPSIPYAMTEEEARACFKDSFHPLQMLEELDAERASEYFSLHKRKEVFLPIWTLSRFSWKIVLFLKR